MLAPPPELAPPPAPEPAKEEAKPSLADKLGFGKNGGFFQPGGLVQIWAGGQHVERSPTTSYGFRLRRIEFVAKGEILPKLLSYRIVADFAKLPGVTTGTSNVAVTAPDGAPSPGTVAVPTTTIGADRSVLQDAFITYISEYADIGIGQFKMPVSLEALQSNQTTLLPERSRVTREYADTRDVGIRVTKKIADVFYYNVSLFNGAGINVQDGNKAKDLALRLEAYPIPGLTVAGSVYGTVGARAADPVKNRVEGSARFEAEGFIAQGEYIHAWTGNKARKLEGHGAYLALAYTIADQWQPAARVGLLDTNLDDLPTTVPTEAGVQRQFELGVNYLVKGYDAKFTAAFAHYGIEHWVDTNEITLQAVAAF